MAMSTWQPRRLSMSNRPALTRFKAAGIHLLASGLVAAVAATLVFWVWHPAPFAAMAGGTSLFVLLVSVDVILGPALTAIVVSPGKRRTELVRDLGVIIIIQLAAFVYGLYAMALARPVVLAFEVDRLRLVTAADIDRATLHEAPVAFQSLSWAGPRMVAAIKPSDLDEQMRSIELGLSGIDLAMQPRQWRDYGAHADAAWKRARPATQLLAKYSQQAASLEAIARSAGRSPEALRFLPLISRQVSWVSVIAEPGATVVGYLPVEGFF